MTATPAPVAALRAAHPDATVVHAPGRVNLIGGHVDYHEGLVVSMAIDLGVAAAATPRTDGRIRAVSASHGGTLDVAADGSEARSETIDTIEPAWGRLVAAVAHELDALGRPPVGADLHVDADLVAGGGLSSSAAFELAVATALCAVADFDLAPIALAQAAQRAELRATGVPCGLQDQLSSVAGVAGHALHLDCRTIEITPIPLPSGTEVVVVDSGVARTLAGSPWTQRRAETFAAAEALGLRVLRDATPDEVADNPRARHVVHEIGRVERFAAALQADDVAEAGRLMIESHASSRDDFGSSISELDVLVELLVAAGAYGARLTGGGFGGCVVALVPDDRAAQIAEATLAGYRARFDRRANAVVVRAADGVRRY